MNGWKSDWRYHLERPHLIPATGELPQYHNKQKQNKDISYALRCYQWSVSCLADPYVPCCSGLCDPYAQADLVTHGPSGSIGHGYRFRLLPVQESFLWTKGASMIISSMCALQLHLLLIHNLLIPQVRLQHAHKCMLHSCMYICVYAHLMVL